VKREVYFDAPGQVMPLLQLMLLSELLQTTVGKSWRIPPSGPVQVYEKAKVPSPQDWNIPLASAINASQINNVDKLLAPWWQCAFGDLVTVTEPQCYQTHSAHFQLLSLVA